MRASLDFELSGTCFQWGRTDSQRDSRSIRQDVRRCGFRREAFYPCYGMAESTLMATGAQKLKGPVIRSFDVSSLERNRAVESSPTAGSAKSLVSSGYPTEDHRVIIVDPETGIPVSDGVVGEIWISGPSIALGYWNRPERKQKPPSGERLRVSRERFYGRAISAFDTKASFMSPDGKRSDYHPWDELLPAGHRSNRGRVQRLASGGRGAAFSVENGDHESLVVVHEVNTREVGRLHQVITDITLRRGRRARTPIVNDRAVGATPRSENVERKDPTATLSAAISQWRTRWGDPCLECADRRAG